MKRILLSVLLIFPAILYAQLTVYPPIGSNSGFSSFPGALNAKGPFILPRMDSAKSAYGVYTDLYINKDSVLMWNNPTTKKSYPVFTGEQGSTVMPLGWNIIYQSPNVWDSHQGVIFDNKGYAYCIGSTIITKRKVDNTTWPVVSANNNATTGIPGQINHFGDGKIKANGRLALAAEYNVGTGACGTGTSSGYKVAEFDTGSLALIAYYNIDSLSEFTGLCFTPDGHLWAMSFCDSLHLFEYDSTYHFLAKKNLSTPIGSPQGLCYNPTDSVFYVSSNDGKIYQVRGNGTVDSVLFKTTKTGTDAYEGIDWNDGVIKWTRMDYPQLLCNVYFISNKKTAKDYAGLSSPTSGIKYGAFNIVGNDNNITNPTLYVASQNGKATVLLNSITGNAADLIYQIGGKYTFDVSARGADANGNLNIYRSSNGTSFETTPVLSLNRLYGGVAINQSTPAIEALEVTGTVKATQFRIASLNTAPASATAPGIAGEVRITGSYIYVCIAANTWVRAALNTW